MSDRFDLVVLSPHLDDGVLSCGGRMAATSAAGGRVLLVTLFAADDPLEPAGALAAELRQLWKLPPGQIVARRRAEDLEACRRLDAGSEHWLLLDAIYRTRADGTPRYPTIASLYAELEAADTATLEELTAKLAGLPAHDLLLAPLAIGGHVDHLLARRAAEQSGGDVAFYEDFPYSEWKWFALERALGRKRDWRAESLPLNAGLVERRRQAILAYGSQVPALFRTEARLAKQLRRAVRRAGGERIWRPSSRTVEPAG